jgi:hypothetical protein
MTTKLLKRRTMIKTLAAAAGAWTVLPDTARCTTTEAPVWPEYILSFLATLARPGGGYAWDEQSEPHLTATYAVIGCHRLLGKEMPNKKAVAEFVRTHHPAELKKLEQIHHEFEFQQIQSLIWLGEDVSSFREQVAGWKKPYVYFKQYEQHGNPIFRFELAAFTCRNWCRISMRAAAQTGVSMARSPPMAATGMCSTRGGASTHSESLDATAKKGTRRSHGFASAKWEQEDSLTNPMLPLPRSTTLLTRGLPRTP